MWRLRARLRQRRVLQLLARWDWKPGVQSLIAVHLGVHKSTISRDLHALMPHGRACPTCHQPWPRRGWREEA
jgi:DNA-binding IclR family transcriptional regulator